jgi:hypothetical protein
MRTPPAYLDECMDAPLIDALRQRGYDLLTAREAATLRATDEGQLAYAGSSSRNPPGPALVAMGGRAIRLRRRR